MAQYNIRCVQDDDVEQDTKHNTSTCVIEPIPKWRGNEQSSMQIWLYQKIFGQTVIVWVLQCCCWVPLALLSPELLLD